MGEGVVAVLAGLIGILGLMVVFAKSPFTSAFSLVGLMVCLGGIYGLIGAHFVAALQVIVYAGAIMVLFVFAIMLLNLNEEKSDISWKGWQPYAALLVSGGVFAVLAAAMGAWGEETRLPMGGPWNFDAIKQAGGNVVAVSGILFSKAYVQFEMISLVILVAIVGALVLAKRKVD